MGSEFIGMRPEQYEAQNAKPKDEVKVNEVKKRSPRKTTKSK